MAQETSKATERREGRGVFITRSNWGEIFGKRILDIGPGDDPLIWADAQVTPFDKPQGDANKIDEYFPYVDFDCVHGSQVMEHLYNPTDFINRCLRILKPGGWIVQTVPDYDLYEKQRFPSKFNPDHKTTWSLWRTAIARQPQPHIHVPTWINQFDVAQRFATLIDTNYDYLAPDTKDQTWLREDGIECFIELLLQKHS